MESVMSTLYIESKYSDLTIKCQDRKFKVHKAIVCIRSKVFAAAVDGKFKEAITSEIDLQDDEPEIVAQMLKFLYTDTYDGGGSTDATKTKETPTGKKRKLAPRQSTSAQSSNSTDSTSITHSTIPQPADASSLLINTKLYIMGDKYDIQPLKDLAAKKYGNALPIHWNSEPFVASLKLVYEETPQKDRSLKDVAIAAAAEHVKELADRSESVALCKENGEIAFDVLKACFTKIDVMPDCPLCHNTNVYHNSSDHNSSNLISTYACRSCGLIF